MLRSLCVLVVLCAFPTLAAPIRVADLDTGPNNRASSPREIVPFANGWLFAARTMWGEELWFTDGTAGGTRMLKDVCPGDCSGPRLGGQDEHIVVLGAFAYFIGSEPTTGMELWRTDGTAQGTTLVRDILPGTAGSSPSMLTIHQGSLYFVANENSFGLELYKSDGTESGTVPVQDICPGTCSSYPTALTSVGPLLMFIATRPANGYELWKTDGTTTALVKDLNGTTASSALTTRTMGVVRSTSGTPYLIFGGTEGTNGYEPWKSDGTSTGTARFADLNAGAGDSYPMDFVVVGNETFFNANTPTTGGEIYRATDTAVTILGDLVPGSAYYGPLDLQAVGGRLMFNADRATGLGVEPYWINGSGVVTLLADIYPGTIGSRFRPFWFSGQRAFGSGFNPTGAGLLEVYAGSVVVPYPFNVSTAPNMTNSAPNEFPVGGSPSLSYDNELYLFQPFGTTGHHQLISDVFGGNAASNPGTLTAAGRQLYFTANTASLGRELYTSDGTSNGTHLVEDRAPGSFDLTVYGARPLGSNALIALLYEVVLATPTTTRMTTLATVSTSFDDAALVNGTWFFGGYETNHGYELWKSDGTPQGTVLVLDAVAGSGSGLISNRGMAAVGNRVIYAAQTATYGDEPWISDGNASGTRQLLDLVTGTGGSGPDQFTSVGGKVIFVAFTAANGGEPYVTDGTTTTLLMDINPGTGGSSIQGIWSLGARALFIASSVGYQPFELWTTDGTTQGTRRLITLQGLSPNDVRDSAVSANGLLALQNGNQELWVTDGTDAGTLDIVIGSVPSEPHGFTAVGNVIYFTAEDPQFGTELFQTDGTLAGTRHLTDIAGGARDSRPGRVAVAGSVLFFSASDGDGDNELWSLSLDSTPPLVAETVSGTMGKNGWYVGDVSVTFTVTDPEGPTQPSVGCAGGAVTMDTASTTFRCSATSAGGASSKDVTVKRDTQPPSLSCPSGVTVEATGPMGAMASFTLPVASDVLDPAVVVTANHQTGELFARGDTEVTVTAEDAAGNTARCAFEVKVHDATAPQVSCPGNLSVDATSAAGAKVTYDVIATDAVDGMPLVFSSHASGSVLPSGTTKVTVYAIDLDGNRSACSFDVTIGEYTEPPPMMMMETPKGCGCSGGGLEALGALALLLTARFGTRPARRRRASETSSRNHVSRTRLMVAAREPSRKAARWRSGHTRSGAGPMFRARRLQGWSRR